MFKPSNIYSQSLSHNKQIRVRGAREILDSNYVSTYKFIPKQDLKYMSSSSLVEIACNFRPPLVDINYLQSC